MDTWFEGENEVRCGIDVVRRSLEVPGDTFAGVVAHMPGMTSVELVEEEPGSVTIRTNEGLMRRTNIATRSDAETLVLEFDEAYAAGSKVTATAHFRQEFTAVEDGVRHRLEISGLEAPGFFGFFYRHFGSGNIGKAFLAAHKAQLEGTAA